MVAYVMPTFWAFAQHIHIKGLYLLPSSLRGVQQRGNPSVFIGIASCVKKPLTEVSGKPRYTWYAWHTEIIRPRRYQTLAQRFRVR